MGNIYFYSIYIRTLGKGGEKYQRLLDSIKSQTIQPQEIIIVLPFGYNPPNERLGSERFAYCEKGMIKQRIYAINDAKTPYILLLDDDVEFEPQYIEKIISQMQIAEAQCCIPITRDCHKKKSKIKYILNRFIGSEVYKPLKGNYYKKINSVGGFVTNTRPQEECIYYSQTGHGSNCFAETNALKSIHFEEELWLENSGYALPDDQVMFYKLYLQGYKIAICLDAYFKHLDSASTNDGKRYLNIARAKAGNYLIFWYRFIYSHLHGIPKWLSPFCITHRIFWECFFYILKYHNIRVIRAVIKGLSFGIKYILDNNAKNVNKSSH